MNLSTQLLRKYKNKEKRSEISSLMVGIPWVDQNQNSLCDQLSEYKSLDVNVKKFKSVDASQCILSFLIGL